MQFVFVTGPRSIRETLAEQPGATILGFLPDLDQHLAAADLAVVQGGLTTCMELTAQPAAVPLRAPAPPLRTDLPRASSPASATAPGGISTTRRPPTGKRSATAILKEIEVEVNYRPVETGGAARAASLLAGLL